MSNKVSSSYNKKHIFLLGLQLIYLSEIAKKKTF